jgi:hypothetical protein
MTPRGRLLELGIAAGLWVAVSACRSDNSSASRGSRTLTRTELFDLRTKCSDLASRAEKEIKNEKKTDRLSAFDVDSFTNRYDPDANRCYVEQFTFHHQTANNGENQTMQYRTVIDAQERVTLVGCYDYVHPSGPHQTNCTDKDSKTISVSEANARMNSLMGESVQWP